MPAPRGPAVAMGQAYGIHMRFLKSELTNAARQLKRLELNDALRALDPHISREQVQTAHTIENLFQCVRDVFRPLLLDLAHGGHAILDVGVERDQTGQVIAAGVWGSASAELGERNWDLLFARVAADRYIVYQPAKPTRWLHEAIRHKQHNKTHEAKPAIQAAGKSA